MITLHAVRRRMPCRERPVLHRHPAETEFYHCAAGGGEQHTDAGRVAMRTGDLFLFPPGNRHIGNGLAHGRSVGLVLTVGDAALTGTEDAEARAILAALSAAAGPGRYRLPLTSAGRRWTGRLLRSLVEEQERQDAGFRTRSRALFGEFLVVLLRDPGCAPLVQRAVRPPSRRERLAGVLRHLRLHFREPLDVPTLAAMAGMGRSRFHQVFREEVGCSPIDHLTALRIAAAREALADPDRTVLAVALDVGFGSLSQFHDRFRRLTGTTPGRYRLTDTAASPPTGPGGGGGCRRGGRR